MILLKHSVQLATDCGFVWISFWNILANNWCVTHNYSTVWHKILTVENIDELGLGKF